MNIKVKTKEGLKQIGCMPGESLLDAMKRQGVYIPAYCGGRGTCGKCGVRCISERENRDVFTLDAPDLRITEQDRKVFSDDQLKAGMRLACQIIPGEEMTVELVTDDESDFEVLVSEEACVRDIHRECETGDGAAGKNSDSSASCNCAYGIAVDIGTTTIAMELVDLKHGEVCQNDSRINHQRAFGADVITRIQASNDGNQEALRRLVLTDLSEGFRSMFSKSGIRADRVCRIVISANTTMCHLLMGYSCRTLGIFPFTPVNIDVIRTCMADLYTGARELAGGLPMEAEVIILPGISAFVGADITAGLLVCGFDDDRKAPSMLIDFGTNGEMAIGNGSRIITTSAAAGPAFEGGNISCGTGSVRGAVCSARYTDGKMVCETIGGGTPVGICGTGVLDITAELVAWGIVDETGLLDDDYFEDGVKIAETAEGSPIVFTQQDIREIQLAKAAVRAGIEVLMKRFGVTCEDVDTVYLAGGFGFRMDVDKAIGIGLLPEGFGGKIRIAGNTSLMGARACLMDEKCLERAGKLALRAEEISLGGDALFNQYYMDAMYFECEDA